MASKAKKHVAEPKLQSKPENRDEAGNITTWYAKWTEANGAVHEAERRLDECPDEQGKIVKAKETIEAYSAVPEMMERRISRSCADTREELVIMAHLLSLLLVPDREGQRKERVLRILPTYAFHLAVSIETFLGAGAVKSDGTVRFSKAKG